jgi:hypothetical protein
MVAHASRSHRAATIFVLGRRTYHGTPDEEKCVTTNIRWRQRKGKEAGNCWCWRVTEVSGIAPAAGIGQKREDRQKSRR